MPFNSNQILWFRCPDFCVSSGLYLEGVSTSAGYCKVCLDVAKEVYEREEGEGLKGWIGCLDACVVIFST